MNKVHYYYYYLIEKRVFHYTAPREGHPTFPHFKSSLLEGLDYRNLHDWMTESAEKRTTGLQLSQLSVQNKHRKLFGYNPLGHPRYNPFSHIGPRAGQTKQKKKTILSTRTFVCLASKHDLYPPTSLKNVQLKKAGLREKKTSLELQLGPKEVDQHLKAVFPKLENSGGYCLLKTLERGSVESPIDMVSNSKIVCYQYASYIWHNNYMYSFLCDLGFPINPLLKPSSIKPSPPISPPFFAAQNSLSMRSHGPYIFVPAGHP
jgi:hypothetical protein